MKSLKAFAISTKIEKIYFLPEMFENWCIISLKTSFSDKKRDFKISRYTTLSRKYITINLKRTA